MRKKAKRTPRRKSARDLLLQAVVTWHAATVLSGQCDTDSKADAYLRGRALRYLKARQGRA